MRDAKGLGLTVPFSLLARAVRLWRNADQMNWPRTTFRSDESIQSFYFH